MDTLIAPFVGYATRQMLAVRLGAEQFAIDVDTVREIMRYQPLTSVPGAANWVLGILMRHGVLYPVVDIRHLLALPPSIDPRPHRMVLLQRDDIRVALGVDAVLDILSVDEGALHPPPQTIPVAQARFISGVLSHNGHPVIALNLEPLLMALRSHV